MTRNKIYIRLSLKISPLNPGKEILVAKLDQMKFEGFVEKSDILECYIPTTKWNNKILDVFYPLEQDGIDIDWFIDTVEDKNWNSIWEQNYSPVFIGESCVIRSIFHKKTKTKYEIIIKPKMSFGTGHHETTNLIIQELIKDPPVKKNVLDIGSGTGILSILSEKLGAKKVDSIDNCEFSMSSAKENFKINKCNKIDFHFGTIHLINSKNYDNILVNIEKNIIINEAESYLNKLALNGKIYLSGFYSEDEDPIVKKIESLNLKLKRKKRKNKWSLLIFEKT
ncbi:MAG: 50S ribosomal protein L11 methyltransferase [Flavobacteriaceae bacterium]|nr:50S ribosomal protein L11 methyltransferase [Flavobacteriaceae bacterium]